MRFSSSCLFIVLWTTASFSNAFSPPSSRSLRQSSALFVDWSKYMTIHKEGLSKEDKEELMPCEVARYGVRNEKVWREDAYNPNGPDIINPRTKRPPPRPPTRPSNSYMNVQADEEPQPVVGTPRKDPPSHLFGRQAKSQPIVDATVVPDTPSSNHIQPEPPQHTSRSPRPPPVGMFSNDGPTYTEDHSLLNNVPPEPAQTRSRSPKPPPVGMFLSEHEDRSLLENAAVAAPTPSELSRQPPPPVGMYLSEVEHTGADSFHVEPAEESGGWGGRSPGPPPVGMFLQDQVGEIEIPASFTQSTKPTPSSSFSRSVSAPTASHTAPSSLPRMPVMQSFQSFRQNHMSNVRRTLMLLNAAIFAYQCITTSWLLIGQRSTPVWPHALTGTTAMSSQPLLRDWMFTQRLANWQPHRYLTAGFVHSGILHLLLSLDLIRHAPSKLERTTGSDVYGTTFGLAVVAGHLGHAMWGDAVSATGAAAGVAGLYGLHAVYEGLQAKNDRLRQQQVLLDVVKGLGLQIVYGLCLPRMFSNAAQLSGFLAGTAAGIVFYLSTPKTAGQRNMAVWTVWLAGLSTMCLLPAWRSAPLLVLQSLFQPGSLTAGRARTYFKGI